MPHTNRLPYTRTNVKSWAKHHIRGFYEDPITPLTADFEIDEPGIHTTVEAFVDMGVPGITIGGNLAEGWNLTPTQWLRIHEVFAEAARGRLELWTILLEPSPILLLEKIAAVQALGYVGAEVINPVTQLVSDDDIYSFFKYLNDHSELALWLYRTPVSGRVMPVSLVAKLSELEMVVGAKEGGLSAMDIVRLRAACHPDFVLSRSNEYYYLHDIQRLDAQVMWATPIYTLYGKLRPLIDEYLSLAEAGSWEQAYKVSSQLDPVRKIWDDIMVSEVARTGSYVRGIAMCKVWFEEIGLPAGPILPPIAQIGPDERERFRARLVDVGVI